MNRDIDVFFSFCSTVCPVTVLSGGRQALLRVRVSLRLSLCQMSYNNGNINCIVYECLLGRRNEIQYMNNRNVAINGMQLLENNH